MAQQGNNHPGEGINQIVLNPETIEKAVQYWLRNVMFCTSHSEDVAVKDIQQNSESGMFIVDFVWEEAQ